MKPTRAEILENWRKKVRDENPIVGAVAAAQRVPRASAVDFFALHHTVRFGKAGATAGLLPLGDANAIVMELAPEFLRSTPQVPLLAGVCATDPFRLMKNFLAEIKKAGFAGVQNFPSLSSIDGNFRKHLEGSGISFAREIEMIRLAKELDLLTVALIVTVEEAEQMAAAGADAIVVQGVAKAVDLDRAAIQLEKTARRIKAVNANSFVLCDLDGECEQASYMKRNCPAIAGFFA